MQELAPSAVDAVSLLVGRAGLHAIFGGDVRLLLKLVLAVSEDIKHDTKRGGAERERIEATGRAKRLKIEPSSASVVNEETFIAAAKAYADAPTRATAE